MPKEVDYTNHWEEEGMVVSETVTSLIALEILPYPWKGKKLKDSGIHAVKKFPILILLIYFLGSAIEDVKI